MPWSDATRGAAIRNTYPFFSSICKRCPLPASARRAVFTSDSRNGGKKEAPQRMSREAPRFREEPTPLLATPLKQQGLTESLTLTIFFLRTRTCRPPVPPDRERPIMARACSLRDCCARVRQRRAFTRRARHAIAFSPAPGPLSGRAPVDHVGRASARSDGCATSHAHRQCRIRWRRQTARRARPTDRPPGRPAHPRC